MGPSRKEASYKARRWRIFRRLLLFGTFLFPLLTAGCRPGDEPGTRPAGATQDTSPPPPTASPADTLPPPPTVSVPDTLPFPSPEGDSLPDPLDSLRARIQRLETENDSLRAAVGVILSHWTPGAWEEVRGTPPQVDSTDEAGDLAQEVLEVDGEQVRNWGIRIVLSVALLFLTGLLIRALTWALDRMSERSAKRRLSFKRLVPVVRILTWFLAVFFIALVILRVDAQGLLATGAALGVAVGFAAQDILKNVLGGLIVLFDQPFQVGDKISVSGTYGEVVSIGLRSTRMETPDDNLVSVPNAQIVAGQVANANAGELNCQVVTDLYLPGWVDEGEAKRMAFEAAASSRYVFLNKPIVVLVKDEFSETFLTHLKVKAYVMDPRYEFLFMSDVTEKARAAFREAGLLEPWHGARAWVELDRSGPGQGPGEKHGFEDDEGGEGEGQ